MNPLISIIVPVYNVEEYLARCLQSLINQTYNHLEIIIVNDGSTDRSLEIAERFLIGEKRAKIINQPNLGLGEARNTGIRNSNGEFATFVDSDDWIEKRMIELLVKSAVQSNADIICCGFNTITVDRMYSTLLDPELNKEKDHLVLCFNEVHNNKRKIITTAWGKLFNLGLLKGNSIFFPLPRFEDTPFFIKAVYYSKTICFVKDSLYNYSVRSGSISNSPISELNLRCFYQSDNLILQFLKDRGVYKDYKTHFESFHFIRIMLYGGGISLYWNNQNNKPLENYLTFYRYLKSQKLFFDKFKPNDLTQFQMNVLKMFKIGLFIGRIHYKLPHIFFRVAVRLLKVLVGAKALRPLS
jgi:glycosyltransferase involved in cell wall biosynthesis